MKLYLLLTLSLGFVSFASEDLVFKYKMLIPYHQNLQIDMPTEVCEGEECYHDIQQEDNSQKMYDLLKETEDQHNVNSPQFLSSQLGRYYHSLKNFMQIHKDLKSCQSDARWWTEKHLSDTLGRLSSNTSKSEINHPCESAVITNILSDEQMGFISTGLEIAQSPLEQKLENELILESLGQSIEARITFSKIFFNKDITSDSFHNQFLRDFCNKEVEISFGAGPVDSWEEKTCNDSQQNLLQRLIQQKVSSQKATPMNVDQVHTDLNFKISQINDNLREYNKEIIEINKKWQTGYNKTKKKMSAGKKRSRILARMRKNHHAELLRFKKTAFKQYRNLYASLHHDSATGALLQTNAVRYASNIGKLEKMAAKWLGFAGFEKKVLTNTDKFPLLSPIAKGYAAAAMRESLTRTQEQVQDLLTRQGKEDNLSYLLTVNPSSAGKVLLNHPEYADIICSKAQDIASSKRNRKILEKAGYIVLGGGIAIAGVATAGGSITVTAMIAATAAGATFTAADFVYQQSESRRNRQLEISILNAYLSGTGDDRSIDDIREHWQKIQEANHYALMALGFGVFDIVGIFPAARAGSFIHQVHKAKGLGLDLDRASRVLNRISKDSRYIKAMKTIWAKYPRKQIGELLYFIDTLPAKKQKILLESLIDSTQDLSNILRKTKVKNAFSNDEFIKLRRIVNTQSYLVAKGLKHDPIEVMSRERQLAQAVEHFFARPQDLNLENLGKGSDAILFFEGLEGSALQGILKQGEESAHFTEQLKKMARFPGNIKNQRKAKKLMALIENVKREGTVSAKDLAKINDYFFILTNSKNSDGVIQLLSKKKVIRQKIESEIVAGGVEEALRKLNILSSQKAIDRFRRLRNRYKNIENTITALALNSIILKINPVAPIVFPPKINLMKNKVVTRELIERIKKQGFDASYDELVKLFGKSASFDAIYGQARSLYLSLITMFSGYLLYQYKDFMIFSLSTAFVSEEDVKKNMKENFDVEEVRQRQFEQWKQGIYDFTGKWPTPEKEKEQWEHLGELAQSLKNDLSS